MVGPGLTLGPLWWEPAGVPFLSPPGQTASVNLSFFQGAGTTLHTILLVLGGTFHTAHTLDQFKELGIDLQWSAKLARKLHAHSVQHAHKLTSTRHAIGKKLNFVTFLIQFCENQKAAEWRKLASRQ
eukprot:1156791-Pelagomonas_calceolata.AAC.7